MELNSILIPLAGGALIGVSASLLLAFNGRVTGISGILSQALARPTRDTLWRWMFLIGMILGGFVMNLIRPEYFVNESGRSPLVVIIAGLLVGYGTILGSGCTSGHGVCGMSRLSVRSILATITFILFGFFAVQIIKHLFTHVTGGAL